MTHVPVVPPPTVSLPPDAPRMIPFLDLKRINARDRDRLLAAMARVLDSGWYILGQEVREFERRFAEYTGVPYAIGVANGMDALTLVFRALRELGRIAAGDEVLVPSNTYIATILALTENRLTPVLVEPDPRTFNMDPARVREAITPRTRAILTVHLYGRLGWSPELQAVADAAGVPIVEDAAQSQGAALDGRRAGSLGLATGTSLYPGKNLGALGDAGVVTTWDAPLAEAVRTIANYGSQRKYENRYKGVNSRLDELQAAMLVVKLDRLDADNARRRTIAARYGAGISNRAIALPEPGPEGAHVWHLYVVRADDRDELQRHLAAHGIQTLVHYPTPPHQQPAYAEWADRSYPIAEAIHRTVLSLPMDPTMSDADVDAVIAACNTFRGAT